MHIRKSYFTAGIHILVWLLFFIIAAIIFNGIKTATGLPPNYFFYTNIYHVGLFYLNAYFLFPRFATRKRWPLYLLSIVALIAFSFYAKLFVLQLNDAGFTITHINLRFLIFPPVPFIIAGIILQVITRRVHAERLQKEQQAARLATELKFLRNQVSPHFLFNMMTNMVALARQKSDLLEPSLMKLSDLLRYMLYESENDKFTIADEAAYLKSYIELQHLRFGDDVNVQMQIDNKDPGCFIEPMLLIPFVENAFKHGIGMVHNPYIHICLTVKEQQLYFSVINRYSKHNNAKDKSPGIGLENVRNRLQLLYAGRYTFTIKDKDSIFKTELKLDLTC